MVYPTEIATDLGEGLSTWNVESGIWNELDLSAWTTARLKQNIWSVGFQKAIRWLHGFCRGIWQGILMESIDVCFPWLHISWNELKTWWKTALNVSGCNETILLDLLVCLTANIPAIRPTDLMPYLKYLVHSRRIPEYLTTIQSWYSQSRVQSHFSRIPHQYHPQKVWLIQCDRLTIQIQTNRLQSWGCSLYKIIQQKPWKP